MHEVVIGELASALVTGRRVAGGLALRGAYHVALVATR